MKNIKENKMFFWTIELLAVATLIFVCTKIKFIFEPLFTFVSVVFVPFVISGFLFYMLNPLVTKLSKLKYKRIGLNRSFASLFIVLVLVLIVVGGIALLVPTIISEFTSLVKAIPDTASQMNTVVNKISHSQIFKHIDVGTYLSKIDSQIGTYAETFLTGLSKSLGTIISTITSVTIIAITVPVMLFYMLKDGQKLIPSIQKMTPGKRSEEVSGLLQKMSATLSSYISGQVIECLFVAVFTTIGYLIIGQPLGVVLGIIAGMANIIPYIGPYIGIAPALIVSLTMAQDKIIWVIIIVIIVQQVDGNIIYPNIIGKSLNIHPLTIIVLLLAAGNIAGIAGMILCIPFYAVVRTIVIYFWDIYNLDKS